MAIGTSSIRGKPNRASTGSYLRSRSLILNWRGPQYVGFRQRRVKMLQYCVVP
jgi:hypothetical protein